MKIAPGWDLEPLRAVVTAFPDLIVQVDSNGAYPPERAVEQLVALDGLRLACIEQPLPPGTPLEVWSALAGAISTPVAFDESAVAPEVIDTALAAGAMSVVCVKPARLGGIGAALEGLARWEAPRFVGGMFEASLGRTVLATVAALPGFSWPGDLAVPSTYLATDLPGRVLESVRRPSGGIWVDLPDGPGVAPELDRTAVADRSVQTWTHPL